ncbi:fatty acid desaturase [Micractinium conductrix]|uniref:Fatty acid desaturase n=1 Tax=Micractinium conductrix TaxID=554055 RepID=A0A2P6V8G8_9CHLO|nr:fatty acid desaturase [Micractinium conductrix]|eukprot:PSC70386.1 fatty acid desaturase [Micractinium conductrix]
MVFFLEDLLTGDTAHRGVVEEEDEARATEIAPQYDAAPEVHWAEGATSPSHPSVLFLVGQPACLLAEAFFPGALPTGTIDVAELVRVRSPLEEEYGPLQKPVHTCTLHAWSPAAAAPAGAAPLLLVACPRELAAEQAGAWARGVLAALAPARAALACTLPAMHYRGAGSPADDDLVFSLHTAAAQAARGGSRAAADLPPQLPAATMLGGLPAALLVECELGGLPAALVAGVQQQQVPDAAFLLALGCATQAALGSLGASPPAAEQQRRQQQGKHELLAALGAGADAVYRSSASSSIFS